MPLCPKGMAVNGEYPLMMKHPPGIPLCPKYTGVNDETKDRRQTA